MEKTKKGNLTNKALMVGTALVSLNSLAVAEAQAATLTSAAASAIIIAPIVLTNPQPLFFGSFTIGAADDTITLTPGGVRSAGGAVGGVSLVSNTATPAAAGVINISSAGGDLNVNITGATITVDDGTTVGQPGTAMNVNAFQISANAGADTAAGTAVMALTGAATSVDVNVGATLNALAVNSTNTGTYSGTFGIAVSYP